MGRAAGKRWRPGNVLARVGRDSVPAPLSPQKSDLHACPVVEAAPPDLDVWEDSFRSPVAQSATADWQPRQQGLLVNEPDLAMLPGGRKICLLAIHGATLAEPRKARM